jgi:hypothetical protein
MYKNSNTFRAYVLVSGVTVLRDTITEANEKASRQADKNTKNQ